MEIIVFQKKADLIREAATPNYLEDVSYSCGVSFQELDVPESLTCVYVLEHNCYDPVEPLYHTAGFDPICVYCASEVQDSGASENYPMCDSCQEKEPIK